MAAIDRQESLDGRVSPNFDMTLSGPLAGDADSPLPEPPPEIPPVRHTPNTDVKRSLRTRHLSMIALGGSIGTGLFLACGEAISGSGPGGALLSYVLIGTMIYFLMAGLGEVATFLPMAGSFSTFSGRFVDPALGFASGWNEFIARSITWTIETLTCGILIKFWLPNFPSWPWELGIFLFIFLVNAFTVRSFAEIEFWMALIKIVTVIVFIIVGFLRIFGAIGDATYFRNWVYKDAPFINGFEGFLVAIVFAGFSFLGSELVGIRRGVARPRERHPSSDPPGGLADSRLLHLLHLLHLLPHRLRRSESPGRRRIRHIEIAIHPRPVEGGNTGSR
jgi:amino acid permease